jgi:hypothetical protein
MRLSDAAGGGDNAPDAVGGDRGVPARTSAGTPLLCSASVLWSFAVGAAWTSPLASERQVLTFRTRAWLSFAPSTCRMPLGQAQGSPELIPEEGSPPGFDTA